MSERDTHFLGFAKLLREEMLKHPSGTFEPAWFTTQQLDSLIAQRVYDLVLHSVGSLNSYDYDVTEPWEMDTLVSKIPDLTQWPEKPIE